jgi:hypothetical protein
MAFLAVTGIKLKVEWIPPMDMEVTSMPLVDETFRPFFLSVGLDLDALPLELKAALEHIVLPLYRRYVVECCDPLEIAAGSSLTFLMAQEVLLQFQLGRLTFCGCLEPTSEQSLHRQHEIDRYLRLLGAKLRYVNLLQRMAEFRHRKPFDPLADA